MGNFLVMMVCTQYPRAQWPVGLVVKLIPSAKRCIRSDCWHFQMEVKLTPKTREFIFRHISYANLRAAILNSLYICTLMDFYYSICFRKTTFNILLVFEKKDTQKAKLRDGGSSCYKCRASAEHFTTQRKYFTSL